MSLASSANKLQNVTVTAENGSVTIVSGNDVGNALNVHANGTVGGTLSITNADDGVYNGVNNAIVIENNLLANGNITITNEEAGIELGKNVGITSQNGGYIALNGAGDIINNATITAGTDVKMSSTTGDIKTTGTIEAGKDVDLSSTEGDVNNSSTIEANNNVNISADAGAISNSGSVTVEAGNIVLTSDKGITSTGEGALLKTESLNGSISAATTHGEVNISEIIAGDTASASSQNGSVIIGSVSGNDVVLSSGASSSGGSGDGSEGSSEGGSVVTSPSIKVGTATVDNSLKLQGDNISVDNVERSSAAGTGALTVDVNGADGAGTAVKNDLVLNIDGDVVFDNLNVTDANVTASGNIDVNKLRVEGEGKTTLVSNKKNENDEGTTITVVGKDVPPEQVGNDVIRDTGSEGDTWLNIKMDEEGSKITVVDDAGRDVNSKDYPAQMSAKLVDYDPYDTYLEHYADMADIFSRSYLIDTPERFSSDILFPAQGGRVVLKQDANGLHLEIVEEQSEQEA